MKKNRYVRPNRNPRYQQSLDLAEENNKLITENNFQNVLAVSNLESEVTRIKQQISKLAQNVFPRNEKLTDAYLRMSGRYSDMVNILRSREDRIELLERELRNYVPDHWLFADEAAADEEDNTEEPEPEPEQTEFDFGDDFREYELKHRKPN
jgi:hypothetical protein|tara:strand:+ start:130 stop:585 length:456 start_codon:yes stop_codon:yes gene_type:complete